MIKVKGHPGIYRRTGRGGKKTYYVRIISGGKQTWKAAGNRLEDADRWRHEEKVKSGSGRPGIQRMKFKALSQEYIKYYQTKARPSNWPRVASVFKHLDGFFGHLDASRVTSFEIEKYIRARQKSGPCPGTINNELLYLAAALNKAVEWEKLERAPAIKKLPVQERRERILADAELTFILENVSGDHRDAIYIGLDTGMRLREIFYLSPRNVDFEAAVIHVEDTKSGKPRSIPMTPRVVGILRRRFEDMGGKLWREKTDNLLSQRFTRERKGLKGIAPWRFHDLRHTFCTRLLREGIDPYTVMMLSGHSKLEMVTRYLHTDDDLKRDAIKRLAASTKNRPKTRRR